MLSSLAKYYKFAKSKHVEAKKQLFVRGIYWGSPRPLLHPALIGGWREAGTEAARKAEREAGGEAGGRVEREAGREAGGEAGVETGREAGGSRLEERLRETLCETELCKIELC